MIGWLQGQIVDIEQPGKLIIDVNGVGYTVETSLQTFWQLNNNSALVGLHIHTIVREDALLLFGFLAKEERILFRALLKVSGIGPKLALSILSSITPAEFIQWVTQQNLQELAKLPGIGKKTAQRLITEMYDKIQTLALPLELKQPPPDSAASISQQTEAISALMALGYKKPDACRIVQKIDDGTKTCEELIRQSLQLLAKC